MRQLSIIALIGGSVAWDNQHHDIHHLSAKAPAFFPGARLLRKEADEDSARREELVRVVDTGARLVRKEEEKPLAANAKSARVKENGTGNVHLSEGTSGFVACVSRKRRIEIDVLTGHVKETSILDSAFMEAAIWRLRNLGNNDPVQLFHVNGELDPFVIAQLEQVPHVTVVDLANALDSQDLLAVNAHIDSYRSFDCKTAALLHSPFQKTMLMDSDTFFFTDPRALWTHNAVVDTGMIFFYDRKHVDIHNPRPPGDVRCKSIMEFHGSGSFNVSLRPYFKDAHKDFCSGITKNEQCSSLVVVDKGHSNAAKTMDMLKKLHTEFIMRDKTVKDWSWGDKEYYWIACELAGAACAFSTRGRPMHIFSSEKETNHSSKAGCTVQMSPMTQGNELLHANLDALCDPLRLSLDSVTMWNPSNTEPMTTEEEHRFPSLDTGMGSRLLTAEERKAATTGASPLAAGFVAAASAAARYARGRPDSLGLGRRGSWSTIDSAGIPSCSSSEALSTNDEGASSSDAAAPSTSAMGRSYGVKALDHVDNWSLRLSPGQQQRLAIGHVLLKRPRVLFLDEATSSVGKEAAVELYAEITSRLPAGAIVVSISHDISTLEPIHNAHFTIVGDGENQGFVKVKGEGIITGQSGAHSRATRLQRSPTCRL